MKFKNKYKLEIIFCIIGLFLIFYPFVSDYINSLNTSKVIDEKEKQINKNDSNEYKEVIEEINKYNESLMERENAFKLDNDQKEKYNMLLDMDGNGYMGYITIDNIGVKLPIYHGTDETTLSKNVGHLEWSSLPIGGKGTHAVLSAHTGQVNNRMFSDLKKLKIGDLFSIHILGQELRYEVEEIKTIDPSDNSDLYIDSNKDLVTLFTCTPYGINTHRLLVRGHRVIDNKEYSGFSSNAYIINKYIEALLLSIIPICLFIIIKTKQNKKKKVL